MQATQDLTRGQMLMMLLAAPGARGTEGEPIQGTTRLQKLLFLMEHEAKLKPTKGDDFAFAAWKFGPVSKELYDDLEKLENLGFLESEPVAEPSKTNSTSTDCHSRTSWVKKNPSHATTSRRAAPRFNGPAKSGPFLFNSQISPVNYFNSSRITWADHSRRRATRHGRRSGTVLSGAGHSRVRFPAGGQRGRETARFARVFSGDSLSMLRPPKK